MAKYRTIKVDYWDDPYTEELPPCGKLLYIYLITSCPSNLGILEISCRKICFETGLSKEETTELLSLLEKDGKIVKDGDFILLTNFVKHQTSTSPLLIKGLKSSLAEVASTKIALELKTRYPFLRKEGEEIPYIYPIHTLSIPCLELEVEKKEEEEEGEGETEEDAPVSASTLIDLWNKSMPQYGFARAIKSTPDRRTKLKARQKCMPEARDIDFWKRIYYVMANSPFCRGEQSRGDHKDWKADFDFPLLSDDRLAKIVEGKYDGGRGTEQWVPTDGNVA